MKKVGLSLFFFLSLIGVCNADVLGGVKVWRSTTPTTPDSGVFIASGAIILHSVVNFNPSAFSSIAIFNSTGGAFTSITSDTVKIIFSTNPSQDWDIILSSGLTYTKLGSSGQSILWDWVTVPLGRQLYTNRKE